MRHSHYAWVNLSTLGSPGVSPIVIHIVATVHANNDTSVDDPTAVPFHPRFTYPVRVAIPRV